MFSLVVVSWNINGLDACMRKGLLDFIRKTDVDFFCFQEVRSHKALEVPGYNQYWNLAHRKGYSGTLVLAKRQPLSVRYGFDLEELDREGRLISLEYNDFILVNVYLPNSQSSLKRQAYREAWDTALYEFLVSLEKPAIICGDFNVAMEPIDVFPENVRNPSSSPGFLSSEQDAMRRLFGAGFIDVFRHLYPTRAGAYTWWSNRLQKRKLNQGWRLDYFLVSRSLLPAVRSIQHNMDVFGSDHCPVTLHVSPKRVNGRREMSEKELSKIWDSLDWPALEEQLLCMQQSLTKAVFAGKDDLRITIQKRIVRSFSAKALAVRHVSNVNSSPGIDGLKWNSSAEKLLAARSLTSKGYHHLPYLRIEVTETNRKTRYANVPVAYDKAMQALYAYSLDPVAEAIGDRKSFAFRKGRSMFDCHAYICKAFEGDNPPAWLLRGDVKSCYDSISHRWLLEHVPMDRKVLREFIKAGAVFNGELYPVDRGISLGASLSPILGNLVLDGLQEYLYQELYGDGERDYANGNLIRFADDFIITARSRSYAEKMRGIVERFLFVRGLALSEEKSYIVSVTDGFTFLSRDYRMINGIFTAKPSALAVSSFENGLQDLILPFRGSQEALIKKINRKLSGWGNYHRVTDAHDAFRRIDAVVQSLLVRHARNLHPLRQWGHIQAKYWFKDAEGEYIYALPNNRAIQVLKLSRAVITTHQPVKTNFNPYLDQDYYARLVRRREISKISGAKLRGIWNRQDGKCFYCGKPMLPDHEVSLVPTNFALDDKSMQYAYVHTICRLFDDAGSSENPAAQPLDVSEILAGITEEPVIPDDPYFALREFFRKTEKQVLTLTFSEIEDLICDKLDWEAYFFPAFWYDVAPGFSGELWQESFPFQSIKAGERQHCIAQSWLSQGYRIQRLNLPARKVVFRKEVHGVSGLQIPKELVTHKIPKNAEFELEEFFRYIIKKYGLK